MEDIDSFSVKSYISYPLTIKTLLPHVLFFDFNWLLQLPDSAVIPIELVFFFLPIH